jgi:hypothetical protein
MTSITFQRGNPPACGSYLVTDGDTIGMDNWWELCDGRVRLPRDIGKPGINVVRQWLRYENVTGWAPLSIPAPKPKGKK